MNDDYINDDYIKARLMLILGFGTSLILELRKYAPQDREEDILWFIQAMENVVYQNKPLPPLPDR